MQNEERISDLQKRLVIGAARKHTSRECFFQIENSNWLRGIAVMRNIINRLYPYSIAETNGFHKPDFIGKLLELEDPPSYSALCQKVNGFADDITTQLAMVRQGTGSVLEACRLQDVA